MATRLNNSEDDEGARKVGSEPDSSVTSAGSGNPGAGPSGSGGSAASFAEELGIEDLSEPIFGARGRFFSAAGKDSPIAEFTSDFLVLHPPQKPFDETYEGPSEDIVIRMDDTGVLLNEIGERKKVVGARFRGRDLYYFWQQKPGTLKHFVVWFDDEGQHHFLSIGGERLVTSAAYQLRNMTHDGELTKFSELESE
ncbi:MAG: hypothetical protein AB7W16_26125 [Candidatus Obscuribacterales bacterium]